MENQEFKALAREWVTDIPEWVWTLIVRWSTLVGGGVMSMAVYVWDRVHGSAHLFSLTSLYWIIAGAFVASGYDAWHKERRFRRAAQASFPKIKASIIRFEALDWGKLTPEEFQTMQAAIQSEYTETGQMAARFTARIDLTNSGLASTTRYWKFSISSLGGQRIDLELSKITWSPPTDWPDLSYWTFDQLKNQYIKQDIVYSVVVCLVAYNVAQRDYTASNFRASFKDEAGQETVCTFDASGD